MKLDPLVVLRVDAGAPVEVGVGPYGTRLISTAAGRTFQGARLSGKVLPNGGDWILLDGDDSWHTDVACCSKRTMAAASTSNIADS